MKNVRRRTPAEVSPFRLYEYPTSAMSALWFSPRFSSRTPSDRTEGHHCDVIVNGDRAFIYYFTHQKGADPDPKLPHSADRTVLQVAELQSVNGTLTADRDKPAYVDLGGN
jgi:hypothetical protein